MKKLIAVLAFVFTILNFNLIADVVMIDDIVLDTPVVMTGGGRAKGNPFVPARLEQGVRVFSLPASVSPSVALSRANTMAWMVGAGGFPADRSREPGACYQVPENGLQWFDFISTGFKSWMGSTVFQNTATTNENGHRIVVSVASSDPVSNCWCRITSNSTNIGSAYFPVGKTAGGVELPFNMNFVGISFGDNGVLESFFDTTLGRWVQVGDDRVYVNGEYPSQVTYSWWYRFGASVQKSAPLPGDVDFVKAEFMSSVRSMTSSLTTHTGGATNVIETVSLTEARPILSCKRTSDGVQMTIVEGQIGIPYYLQMSAQGISGFVTLPGFFYSGMTWNQSTSSSMNTFRLSGTP